MSSSSKKGAGIQFVLPPMEVAKDGLDEPAEDTQRQDDASWQPRGGVASIAMAVSLGRDVREQFEQQKIKLAEYEKAGSPPIKLDPRRVKASRYANRHEASYATAEFAEFKTDIRESGGNLVPVKVRPVLGALAGEPDFETIYGHRRHQACLEEGLPLTALVQAVDDRRLFVDMDRENRGRASLSAWEQGIMYVRALGDGLFSSQTLLAAELGLSKAVVSRAVAIGNLPQEVVACFSSPLVISFRSGIKLSEAVNKDDAGVLRRAAEVFALRPRLLDSAVLRFLVSGGLEPPPPKNVQATSLFSGKRKVGKVNISKDGALSIELTFPAAVAASHERLIMAIKSAIQLADD